MTVQHGNSSFISTTSASSLCDLDSIDKIPFSRLRPPSPPPKVNPHNNTTDDMALRRAKAACPLLMAAFLYYGSISRLTSGRYTSQHLYQYQTERAPNDDSVQAWSIPLMDATLATCLLRTGRTRGVAAFISVAFFALGVAMRLNEGKDWQVDAMLMFVSMANAAVIWS